MIEVYPDNKASKPFGEPLTRKGNFLGRYFIKPITRWLRAKYARKGIIDYDSILDLGCGDCYFLLRTNCKLRIGLDFRFGDDITKDLLGIEAERFQNVAMLAVIEHISDVQVVLDQIYRILKKRGRLIITTPTPSQIGEWINSLYSTVPQEEHEEYFDLPKIRTITKNKFSLIKYKKFLFGFNQLFVFEKTS